MSIRDEYHFVYNPRTLSDSNFNFSFSLVLKVSFSYYDVRNYVPQQQKKERKRKEGKRIIRQQIHLSMDDMEDKYGTASEYYEQITSSRGNLNVKINVTINVMFSSYPGAITDTITDQRRNAERWLAVC